MPTPPVRFSPATSFGLRQAVAGGAVLLALLAVPTPLLPPDRLAAAIGVAFGIGWKSAYLIAAVTTQATFYAALGLVAAFALPALPTPRSRWLHTIGMPVAIVGVALLVRSLKAGHAPVWSSGAVPAVAVFAGAWLGLGLLYRRVIATLAGIAAVTALLAWSLLGGASTSVSIRTQERLRHIIAAGPTLPRGDARFGAMLSHLFEGGTAGPDSPELVEANRAAILAWGIVLGHEQLARFLGLDPEGDLVRKAAALRAGTTLRGRGDWARHYALSAALGVLEHPLMGDAAGLLKEQLDAHAGNTGFSFGDLAADRAGVRFAVSATASEEAARGMRARLARGFVLPDFFPDIADLPEGLTVGEFRRRFGMAGSDRYRELTTAIEERLDSCAALRQP